MSDDPKIEPMLGEPPSLDFMEAKRYLERKITEAVSIPLELLLGEQHGDE